MEVKQYFEGTLQLRDCTDDVLKFVKKKISAEKGVSIAKEIKVRNGVDIYLSSNTFLRKLGKMLKLSFPGVMKETFKLYTRDRQTSKLIYRGTVLFRMPCFKKGDIGMFNGEKVKVISVGAKVALQDTKTGRKMQHKFDYVNDFFRSL